MYNYCTLSFVIVYNILQVIYWALKEVLEIANYCHLSYEDRKNIEDGLNENKLINFFLNQVTLINTKILIMIKIYYVLNFENYLLFAMVVSLEVIVKRRDILIMQKKLMTFIEKLKAKLEKVLI